MKFNVIDLDRECENYNDNRDECDRLYVVAIPEVNDCDNLESVVFVSKDLNLAKQAYIQIKGYKALYSV